jgi:hypothetical protein
MTVTDIASDTWLLDLSEPDDVSVASIAQWYRVHIGDLNNLINQGFNINSSYEIVDENGTAINDDAASIFKKLYEIHYFKKQSKSYLGAAGINSVTQVTQDGTTVRGVDRNGIAKTYNDLLKESKVDLKQLLNNYKYNRSTAKHVETDDKYTINEPQIFDSLNNSTSY